MQRIDFFRLDRPIQERFVASAHGTAPPLPLAIRREPVPPAVLRWAGLALLAIVALIGLSRVGYGDLYSSLAVHPEWLGALYLLLGLAAAFCLRRAVAGVGALRSLPYAPGLYLFPSGVIDTRTPSFAVHSLKELSRAEARDRAIVVQFADGASFRFSLASKQHAQEVERALGEFSERLRNSLVPPTARELALLDPLCDNGFKNPFSPPESMRPPAPKRFPIAMLGWLLGGALLGAVVFLLRNHFGETALYRVARAEDTRAAYVAYVDQGGTRPEVRDILLPRTELAAVVSTGSLESLERFAASHRDSKIATEADIALQHALRAALEKAKQEQSLTALKEFQRAHGSHPSIAPQVERAIEEHWRGQLASFAERARPKPEKLGFFQRLLAYTAKHGSRVELRFRRRIPESVPRAESMIRKSVHFGGNDSLPMQYFDTDDSERREAIVAKELMETLTKLFPKDLVDFQLAPPMPDSDEEFPSVTVPTLLITHRTEMSGGYLLKNPKAALTGIGVLFRVTFQIPGDKEGLYFKLSTWNAPELKIGPTFPGFSHIYDEMAMRAFTRLPQKYLADLVPGLIG